MRFQSLEIARTSNYETPPNTLKGVAMLQGDTGQVTVVLSPEALCKALTVISEEMAATAKNNAKAVTAGMRNASTEPLLAVQESAMLAVKND
jgi:hypothetical protein